MQVQIKKPRKTNQLKIGIVGPEESKWTQSQKEKAIKWITQLLKCGIAGNESSFNEWEYSNIVLVLGHCPKCGVDIWAETIADKFGIQKEIYPAEVNQWDDAWQPDRITENEPLIQTRLKGYRSRNIQIAEASDIVYCIVPKVELSIGFDITKPETLSKKFACYHCHKVGHPTNGGCYTLKVAKRLGKEIHLIVIE